MVAAAMPMPRGVADCACAAGRSASAMWRARRLVRFADFGLHQQRDVARDLSAGAGEDREGGGDLRQPVAVGVPRCVRRRQIEQRREPVGHRQAVLAERRERPGGAAELQRQRLLAQPAQALARARQGRRVARELEPERHRQRVLQRGARHRGGAAMAAGDRGEAVDGAVEVGDQRVDAGAQLEHQRAVDQVLGAGAPVHEAGGIGVGLGDLFGERRHQRRRDVAGAGGGLAQRREIIAFGLAGSADPVDALAGITATAASARASATSKSSMRCRWARSSTIARIAALEISGVSSEEGFKALVMEQNAGTAIMATCQKSGHRFRKKIMLKQEARS